MQKMIFKYLYITLVIEALIMSAAMSMEDFAGHYVELNNHNKQHLFFTSSDLEILKENSRYYIKAFGVNITTKNMIEIKQEPLTQIDSNNWKIKECNLKIKILKDSKILISHDHLCGGAGTSLNGTWQKVSKFKLNEIERSLVPDIENRKICQEGSRYGNFLSKVIIKNQKYLFADYSKLFCEGSLSMYSGSRGSLFKIYDSNSLETLFQDTVYKVSVIDDTIEVELKASFDKCKSGVVKAKIIKQKNKFILKDNACMSK
jgi:hypothetical protein